MAHRYVALVAILFMAILVEASAQTAKRRGPVIRQVDHLLIESSDPEALFNIFTETLQLPVAWPVAEHQGFMSGGLWAGNVILDLFQYANRKDVRKRKIAEARYTGLAFEPYPLSGALLELQTRGIPYSPPQPQMSTLPDGSQGVVWTTVALPSLSYPRLSIFLYEYSPLFLKVEVRRKQLGNRLTLNGKGPLGLESVSEIVLAAKNFEKDQTEWKRLLGNPTPAGNWSAGKGPAIRLVRGTSDRIQKIVLKVESLDRTKTILKKQQLLGSITAKEISLNPTRLQGLNIRLVDE